MWWSCRTVGSQQDNQFLVPQRIHPTIPEYPVAYVNTLHFKHRRHPGKLLLHRMVGNFLGFPINFTPEINGGSVGDPHHHLHDVLHNDVNTLSRILRIRVDGLLRFFGIQAARVSSSMSRAGSWGPWQFQTLAQGNEQAPLSSGYTFPDRRIR